MATTRPNVLLICADHWQAASFGIAGNKSILTPGLNEISLTGVRYTNAYSECPVCIPARRTLMTGQSPRSHGDRVFEDTNPMPDVTTVAQAFRDAGYQSDAVGKLHVHPQRDRIGFDNVILDDESRPQWGVTDDYDTYLGDAGFPGRQNDHGLSNNQYYYRAWHLPEETHPTNWAARNMSRVIKRRDPTKPAFWYLGFRAPHPPLVPPQAFLDLYRDIDVDDPYVSDWATTDAQQPYAIAAAKARMNLYSKEEFLLGKKAFYALCTQVDYQIRYLIGTLRLEGLLDNTIICFTSDHGDMLGNHDMVAKRLFYQSSANVPMIIRGVKGCTRLQEGSVDKRLVGLQDVMPTLLDLCDIASPDSVDGISMVDSSTRDYIYGECGEDNTATRMIRDEQYKLIYYPVGNHFQLFDIENDPQEMTNLAAQAEHKDTLDRLVELYKSELYGCDENWVKDGQLIGTPNSSYNWTPHRSLNSQRGDTWPPSPTVDIPQVEWSLEKTEVPISEDE